MTNVNERLKQAARDGSEVKVNVLLTDPGCDALSKDVNGTTALMWAAMFGHEACVRVLLPMSDVLAKEKSGKTALMCAAYGGNEGCVGLLLPVSDALAKANNGMTASAWARNRGSESVGQFIDAYALAQGEQDTISVEVGPGAPRGRAVRRV